MKRTPLTALLAIPLGTAACVGGPVDPASPVDEPTGQSTAALNQYSVMGGLGWSSQVGPSTDLVIDHQVAGVANKWATFDVMARFPSLSDVPATPRNFYACTHAYVEAYAYVRATSQGPWTQVHTVRAYGVPTIGRYGVLTSCVAVASLSDCDAIGFSTTTSDFRVVVGSAGDGSYLQPKTLVVRYQSLNPINCP